MPRRADRRSAAASAYRRLYSAAGWRARRRQQLLAEPLCCYCAALERYVSATIADHVVPHKGDEELFWEGELQSLCKACHDGVKAAEEARGWSLAIDEDGYPLDPRHPSNRLIREP